MSNASVITNNLQAMFSNRQLGITSNRKAKSAEKLSSGFKINRAADDAAGLTISEKMRFMIRGLNQGADNIQDGVSFCQVADGALNEVHDMLNRLTELAVHGSNGTLTDQDRQAISEEADAIKGEMQRIFNTTSFNERKIFPVPYVPDVSGMPDDFEVYNVELSGGAGSVKYGGIEIDNVRYTWDELGVSKYLGSDGTTWQNIPYNTELKDYVIDVDLNDVRRNNPDYLPENGETVILRLTQGQTLPNLERVYTWDADEDGIYINNIKAASWDDLGVTDSGKADGVVEFSWHGINYSFETGEDDKKDIIAGIHGDWGGNVKILKAGLSDVPKRQAVDYAFDLTFDVSNANKHIMEDDYRITADTRGVTIALSGRGDSDKDSSDVEHTFIKWEDFTNTKTGNAFKIQDFGISNMDNNPTTANQTFSEEAEYLYKDEVTGIAFKFTIRDEASRDAIISSMNNNDITEIYVNPGTVSSPKNDADDTIRITNNRITGNLLSSFRLQKELGRDFNVTDTLDFNMEKSVIELSDLTKRGEATLNPNTGNVSKEGEELTLNTYYNDNLSSISSTTKSTVIDSGNSDPASGIYALYSRERKTGVLTIDEDQRKATYSQTVQFGYSGKYDGEELKVNDGSDHEIDYYDHYWITRKYDYYEDTYSQIGTVSQYTERVGEETVTKWQLTKPDGTVTKDYEFNPDDYSINVTAADTGNFGTGVRTQGGQISEVEHKTRTVTNSTATVSDVVNVALDYDNATRNSSVFLSEDPENNTRLYTATYSNNINNICQKFLSGYNEYDKPVVSGNNSYTNTVSVTANTSTVEFLAQAKTDRTAQRTMGNVSAEPEYGRLKSIMPKKELTIQAGDPADNTIKLTWYGMNLSSIGLVGVSMKSQESSQLAIGRIQEALDIVSEERSTFGAYQNRLEHAMAINLNTSENLQDAESRIRDTDMAKEIANYTKDDIMAQAAGQMLARENQNKQNVLSLLQ